MGIQIGRNSTSMVFHLAGAVAILDGAPTAFIGSILAIVGPIFAFFQVPWTVILSSIPKASHPTSQVPDQVLQEADFA